MSADGFNLSLEWSLNHFLTKSLGTLDRTWYGMEQKF